MGTQSQRVTCIDRRRANALHRYTKDSLAMVQSVGVWTVGHYLCVSSVLHHV